MTEPFECIGCKSTFDSVYDCFGGWCSACRDKAAKLLPAQQCKQRRIGDTTDGRTVVAYGPHNLDVQMPEWLLESGRIVKVGICKLCGELSYENSNSSWADD